MLTFLHSIQISVFGYGRKNAVYLSVSTKALIYTENSVARGDVTIHSLLQSTIKCNTLFSFMNGYPAVKIWCPWTCLCIVIHGRYFDS